MAGEPVSEREGDPRPLLPVLTGQRRCPVQTSLLSPILPVRFDSLKLLLLIWCVTDLVARREFVKKNYGDIKARNPSLPFLVRECSGVQPQLWARYGTHPSISSSFFLLPWLKI